MKIQKTFEAYMGLGGVVLVLISLIYDAVVINMTAPGSAADFIAKQEMHLEASLWIFRTGAVIILAAACIRVVRGMNRKK